VVQGTTLKRQNGEGEGIVAFRRGGGEEKQKERGAGRGDGTFNPLEEGPTNPMTKNKSWGKEGGRGGWGEGGKTVGP